jgi:hypothetical protein
MSCKYGIAVLYLLVMPCFPVLGQEDRDAWVYFAEGGDFILANGGRRTVYRPETLGPGGCMLHEGDILQTGPGTFVEIFLSSRGLILKAAENTTVTYHRAKNGISLELDYGRVLLTGGEGEESPGERVFIHTGAADMLFQQGIMGVDYMVLAEDALFQREPVFRGYVFSGAADLISHANVAPPDRSAEAERAFPVNAMEMTAMEKNNGLSYIERKPLSQDIINYWNRHKPVGLSSVSPDSAPVDPAAVPVAELAAEAEPQKRRPVLFVPPDYDPFFRANKIKNGLIAGGITFSLLGTGMEALAWYRDFGSGKTSDILMYTGYGVFGLGILSLGTALFINPRLPESNGSK